MEERIGSDDDAAAGNPRDATFAAAAPSPAQKKHRFLRKKEAQPVDDDDDEPLQLARRKPASSSFRMKRPPLIGGTSKVVRPCDSAAEAATFATDQVPAAALVPPPVPAALFAPPPMQASALAAMPPPPAQNLPPIEACTGLIIARWQGFTACGTATLIASRKLLTARHNIILKPNEEPAAPAGGSAGRISFYPGFIPEYNDGKPNLSGCGDGIRVTEISIIGNLDIAVLTLISDAPGVHEFPRLKICPSNETGAWTVRGYGVKSAPRIQAAPGGWATGEHDVMFFTCTQTGSSGAAMLHEGEICAVVREHHAASTIATPLNDNVIALINRNL